ncbi:acyltransferase family protein [Cohnella phaseoli]|uniref:Peptidoglycan/LPS O-acetylase OafA/YrhL n=1 Tax=Cohnella phaseoli TaxID=456490 RepID=A0A3D9KD29_9BACL|nr:acyltransferase [Cohnella phaseoli]RED84015.1 peptidoglycan/LPS O-acetylase OafA/YrhL [Cohnella phaseoli]
MDKAQRVSSLDHLRGIMAILVMVYHFSGWIGVNYLYPLNEINNRLGIYAVSAFYLISGVSLALVYMNQKVTSTLLKSFAVKRLYRIVPLFYLATTLTLIVNELTSLIYSNTLFLPKLNDLFYNYSLLFSWFDHDGYIATGAWSIGNELVFYSALPLILIMSRKSVYYLITFFGLSLILTGYFSTSLINDQLSLAVQWTDFISPLNQMYLFIGGLIIGWLYANKKIGEIWISKLIFIASVLIFIFFPINGEDQINYVTGMGKIVLSIAIFSMVISAMNITIKENHLKTVLDYFGEISYSLYLLHPIVFTSYGLINSNMKLESNFITMIILMIFTILISTVTYHFVEKPMIKSARREKNGDIETGIKRRFGYKLIIVSIIGLFLYFNLTARTDDTFDYDLQCSIENQIIHLKWNEKSDVENYLVTSSQKGENPKSVWVNTNSHSISVNDFNKAVVTFKIAASGSNSSELVVCNLNNK